MIGKITKPTAFKISLFITLFVAALNLWNFLGYSQSSFADLLDKKVIDLLMQSKPVELQDPQVAIVAIDTKAVDHYGRWPWGRNLMAQMVKELRDYYGVRVIGFDIVFSEPDSTDKATKELIQGIFKDIQKAAPPTLRYQSQLRRIKYSTQKKYNNDAQFARELARTDSVVSGYFFFNSLDRLQHISNKEINTALDRLEGSEISQIKGVNYLDQLPMVEGLAAETNIPALINPQNLQGYFNIIPDHEDGTVRRAHLLMKFQDRYYPSLDLQIIRRYLGNPPIQVIANEGGVEKILIAGQPIDTASDGSIILNYRGPAFTFPHYSVYDVIEHLVPQHQLQDMIVLIGATEVGVFDLRTTPVGVNYPGVEVHATLLDNILAGDYYYHSDFIHLVTLLLIIGFGLLLGFTLPKLKALAGALLVVVLLGLFWTVNLHVMTAYFTWVSFIYISMVIILNWMGLVLFQFFGEEKDKRFIKGAFGQYLSPSVIDDLVKDPKMLKLGGEKKELTAFFSDLQGFSSFSEKLSPEELVELLNDYLTVMTNIIMKHGGTVDKFEGDAIIAFFGAPLNNPEHALSACKCALEMQSEMAKMRVSYKAEGRPELHQRIGLNSGLMVVGNMGSAQRMDYTIMGDAVNLAARLEGVNKGYKTYTMISDNTKNAIGDACFARELDLIRVVGKKEPTRIYELLAMQDEIPPEEQKPYLYYQKGLQLYREQDFEEAKKYFAQCIKMKGDDGASKVLYTRCQRYIKKAPAADWDGVYQITNK